jgi:predicted GH43/DUF377 family glycosyl hydrolase
VQSLVLLISYLFARIVGQPIQAADPLSSGSSRLKAGCRQDCLPHYVVALACFLLSGCGRYRDFTLPTQPGGPSVTWHWEALAEPVLNRGGAGEWDAVDVLNPSVIRQGDAYYNYYSGFDGKTWHTGLAVSGDGIAWRKEGKILSPDPATWEADAIAANGSALADENFLLYYYQAGKPNRIGLARSSNGHQWQKHGPPVLDVGPRGSWDERGIGDPQVLRIGRSYYMFYLGMDRARRQRIGVAVSDDGVTWFKLRSNPILELGEYGAFDEDAVGEPAVWASHGYYWMLYTGQNRGLMRRLGLARSRDGVAWEKLPAVFAGDRSWDSKVICDPSVLLEGNTVRVWFGGGDVASRDQNLHGQIGLATLQVMR